MPTSSVDNGALHTALETHFHYPAFRPGQLDALHHVLNGRDTLVVMPTGSGVTELRVSRFAPSAQFG